MTIFDTPETAALQEQVAEIVARLIAPVAASVAPG